MSLLSLITVLLYGTIRFGTILNSFDIKIGGLNETELFDLRQIAEPLLNSEVEMHGAWSAIFRVSDIFVGNANWRIAEAPVEKVAPFLSRIKSWGYKITFYNSHTGELQYQGGIQPNLTPVLSYTWILEKDSEIVFLSPIPPNSTSTTN